MPGEASVPFEMGKLYKQMGALTAAQQQFEAALSYNAVGNADAATIKAALEKLGIDDGDEDEEM